MEKKNLHVNFNGTNYAFTAEPLEQKANELVRFKVDLGDNNSSVIEYQYDSWQQVTGRQIFTDLMISMGFMIQRHFPEVFS